MGKKRHKTNSKAIFSQIKIAEKLDEFNFVTHFFSCKLISGDIDVNFQNRMNEYECEMEMDGIVVEVWTLNDELIFLIRNINL